MSGKQDKLQPPQEVNLTASLQVILLAIPTYGDFPRVEALVRAQLAARKSQLWAEHQTRVQSERAAERRASREAVRVAELSADAVAAPYAVKR